ncbi:Fosfomycin resistance protein FosA [Cronobacter condimenti 1330]|uniref:Fosfomycin resistance protein FosA n=1 Tax=Cronobacter condimenti 1330 TaxID=1073999 RepID=K8A222_9ENTR|nr:Fosfomycin resistance protein FosA [Cronobacter condimenti 1330]
MLTGLNHLTLAVGDVGRSVAFYHALLGLRLHARWDGGAYLSCGELWLCLSPDGQGSAPAGYTHYAFSISEADFPVMSEKLTQAGVRTWKTIAAKGIPGTSSTRTDISLSCMSATLPRASPPAVNGHTRE